MGNSLMPNLKTPEQIEKFNELAKEKENLVYECAGAYIRLVNNLTVGMKSFNHNEPRYYLAEGWYETEEEVNEVYADHNELANKLSMLQSKISELKSTGKIRGEFND